MEPAELISEEWGFLSGVYTAEEADFMTQLLGGGNYSVPEEKQCGNSSFGILSSFWPSHEPRMLNLAGINNNNPYFPSNVADTNLFCFSQGSSSSTDGATFIFPTISSGTVSCDHATQFDSMSIGVKFSPHSFQWTGNLVQQMNENTDEEYSGLDTGKLVLARNNLQANKEFELIISETAEEHGIRNYPSKRFRSSIEVSNDNMRNRKSKMNPKYASMSSNEKDGSCGLQRQNPSSCFSEDDSNASLELTGGLSSNLSPKKPSGPNISAKSRATTSAATDPQSLYARKRRERINERLRILQKLVPNGTKVDISTMLEEAVQYVKFLQLQIKLLSSDDLWMYAPIAYNGINMGPDLEIPPTK